MFQTKQHRLLFAAVLVLTLLAPAFVSLTAHAAAPATPDVYHIVTLGDSVTAGFEPEMKSNPNLVPYGYADRLKEQALYKGRGTLANYGILGLNSTGLNHYITAVKNAQPVHPDDIQSGLQDPRIQSFANGTAQAHSDLAAADLIVITIGGNDVRPIFEGYKSLSAEELTTQMSALLVTYTANLKQVLSDIEAINKTAEVVLADQYQPVPKLAGATDYTKLESAATLFTAATDDIASSFQQQGAPVKVAHLAKAFNGYEISYTHILEGDIHPNQFGYEEIANVISNLVWGSYRKTDAALGKASISIVAKGQELKTSNAPIIKNGQTFVAIGDIVQAMGATVKWDSHTSTATISYGQQVVVIPVGAKAIKVNGAAVPTSTPAFVNKVNGGLKTYVPLTLLSQGLGFDAQYAAHLKTAFINP